MVNPKLGKSPDGKDMHYSVGAIIKIDGKYLMVNRLKKPLGYACPAGHVDENETPEEALLREVKEETGLTITKHKLLFEDYSHGFCSKGVGVHYWYVYECEAEGKITLELDGAKSIGLYSKEEILSLNLEKPSWEDWFKRLKII